MQSNQTTAKEVMMNKTMKRLANTAADFSRESKVKAIIASPLAAFSVIGIKIHESVDDIHSIWKGNTFKKANSRKPTE